MSFKHNQVASRGILYTGFVNSPFAHSLNLNPPTLFLCVCRPPSTTHLLSFTSLRPISLCAGAWTVSVACNTNYCALLGSREQRGEITEVWSTNLQSSASASLSLRRHMSPGAVWVQVLVHYQCLASGCIYRHVMHWPRQEDKCVVVCCHVVVVVFPNMSNNFDDTKIRNCLISGAFCYMRSVWLPYKFSFWGLTW